MRRFDLVNFIWMILVGNTPLSYAVRSEDNVDAVRYLLDHDADPDKPVDQGCTSLHIAVAKGLLCMHTLSRFSYVSCDYVSTYLITLY